MDESFLDILFILKVIKEADDTLFQRECCLEFIGRHFKIYNNAELKNRLMNFFDDKFPPIITTKYEA